MCVPSCRRPALLRDCLDGIARLVLPEDTALQVVVVDNDAAGTAREVCEAVRGRGVALHYCIEPRRGLASARNRLLETALPLDADWIGFLDDDEIPDPRWLVQHLEALARYGADVSCGPVLPAGGPDAVHTAERLRSRRTGSTPRHVAANNVLFRRSLAAEQGLRFDAQFDFLGGEDFDFFDRSAALGNRHVWTAEAIVHETITPERSGWRYLFHRHFSGATASVARYRKQRGPLRAWLHFGIKAAGKLLGGSGSLLLACVHAPRRRARDAVKRFANAAGYLAALCSFRVERYR